LKTVCITAQGGKGIIEQFLERDSHLRALYFDSCAMFSRLWTPSYERKLDSLFLRNIEIDNDFVNIIPLLNAKTLVIRNSEIISEYRITRYFLPVLAEMRSLTCLSICFMSNNNPELRELVIFAIELFQARNKRSTISFDSHQLGFVSYDYARAHFQSLFNNLNYFALLSNFLTQYPKWQCISRSTDNIVTLRDANGHHNCC
jgi:hypothetical protein